MTLAGGTCRTGMTYSGVTARVLIGLPQRIGPRSPLRILMHWCCSQRVPPPMSGSEAPAPRCSLLIVVSRALRTTCSPWWRACLADSSRTTTKPTPWRLMRRCASVTPPWRLTRRITNGYGIRYRPPVCSSGSPVTGGRPSVELSNDQFLTNHSRTRILAKISTGDYVRGVSPSCSAHAPSVLDGVKLITFDWVAPERREGGTLRHP